MKYRLKHLKQALVKQPAGFSLIELIVVLAIAGITLAVAVPSFRSTIQTNRIAAQSSDLISTLQLARSEASTRKNNIIVTSINNDWSSGYRVWEDQNNNTSYDAGEEIVEVAALEGQTTLSAAANGAAVNQLIFNSKGFIASPSASITLDMIAHDCKGTNRRSIQIGLNGQIAPQAINCN